MDTYSHGGVSHVLNGALGNLLHSVLQSITGGSGPGQCSVLNLVLGPVNLTVPGLVETLDNCASGPVTVTVSALLGNLLCNLTHHGLTFGSLLGGVAADVRRRSLRHVGFRY